MDAIHNNNNYGKYYRYLITRSVFNNLIPVCHELNKVGTCYVVHT